MKKGKKYICLKSIVEEANKGYIDDADEVEEVMDDLLNMPLEQFIGIDREGYIECIIDMMVSDGLDRTRIGKMTYRDMIAFLDNVPDNRKLVRGSDISPEGLQLCYLRFLSRVLSDKNHFLATLVRFRAVTIKSYFDFIDRHCTGENWRVPGERYDAFKYNCRKYLDFSFSKEHTMGFLINKMVEIDKSSWSPWTSIDEFRQRVLFNYDMFRTVQIDLLKEAFPDEISYAILKGKYKSVGFNNSNRNEKEENICLL